MFENPLDVESPDKFPPNYFVHYQESAPQPKKKVGLLDQMISLKKVKIDDYMQAKTNDSEHETEQNPSAVSVPL